MKGGLVALPRDGRDEMHFATRVKEEGKESPLP
jgi:hypothetical protein